MPPKSTLATEMSFILMKTTVYVFFVLIERQVPVCVCMKCVNRLFCVGGGPVRFCACYEHVWATPHVIHKVRAVIWRTVGLKSCITNNVFWTEATGSRQFVPVSHNSKCHHFQGQKREKKSENLQRQSVSPRLCSQLSRQKNQIQWDRED